ncbi:MAG: rhomboid family intramembrane serine protease [Chitinophagaceae bacterium]|nr:rhomboid family intramembrane serine protease [Chitinophagaceae bacterium]
MSVLKKNRRKSLLLGNDGNTLVILIAVNLIMFVLINFIKISYFLGGSPIENYYRDIVGWIMVPGEAIKLAGRPWTVLTHMFSHDGVWSLIGTLLWLWGFGFILQSLTGNRHLAPLYILGGIAGVFAFSLSVNLIPVLEKNAGSLLLEGGKASVMAIAVATTTLAPNYRIFPMLNGGIPLWVLTMIFVIFDYALIASSGAGIGLAHLAGAGMGFLYMSRLKAGSDWGEWMHRGYNWFFGLFEPAPEKEISESLKREIFYKTDKQPPYTRKQNVTQQRVDELLDKINQKGMHTLTDEEREYLKMASKEEL